jgi:rod shape-determining protein MreD
MSRSPGLLLPGERAGGQQFVAGRAAMAAAAGFLWLPLQGTLVPALGLSALPFDPLLPLVAAFALGGRRLEAWVLALVLGVLSDSYTGVASGRLVLQYAIVVCLAAPLHGRVVLRDRLVPAFGVSALALLSGLAVLVLLGAMGATQPSDATRLPLECLGTGAAAVVLWPLYRRIAGWQGTRTALR